MLKIGQQRRAFHEAGHAVAAIAHGLRVQSVSLPAAGASTTNVDRAIYLAADDPNARVEALRVDIVVVLAGPAAQMWLRPLKSKELADDLKLARAWSTLAAFLASGQSVAELGSDGKIAESMRSLELQVAACKMHCPRCNGFEHRAYQNSRLAECVAGRELSPFLRPLQKRQARVAFVLFRERNLISNA